MAINAGDFRLRALPGHSYAGAVLQGQERLPVLEIHHVGNFRQPDVASWVTLVDAIPALAA